MGSGFSKQKGRSSRKPKYRNAGVPNDSIRHSIGDQTDFRADDDHANPRNNHNSGVHTNHRNNGVHANPNTNTEGTHNFGIQANSSDDDDDVDDEDVDDEDDHEPSFPQGYTSAEKEKGIATDDGFSESSSQYPPIYDSDRSGLSCYRPFYHGQEPENVYQNWQRMEEEVPRCGGYDHEMPSGYYGGNYYEPPQNWAWTGYHDNNYGSYCYDHNMNHQSHGQNAGVSWGESFAKDVTDEIFGGVDPYSEVGRY